MTPIFDATEQVVWTNLDDIQQISSTGLLRGCLKSPDSVKFGDYTRSFQLPNTWAESYARTVSVEISGLFKHPLNRVSYASFARRSGKICSLWPPGERSEERSVRVTVSP